MFIQDEAIAQSFPFSLSVPLLFFLLNDDCFIFALKLVKDCKNVKQNCEKFYTENDSLKLVIDILIIYHTWKGISKG